PGQAGKTFGVVLPDPGTTLQSLRESGVAIVLARRLNLVETTVGAHHLVHEPPSVLPMIAQHAYPVADLSVPSHHHSTFARHPERLDLHKREDPGFAPQPGGRAVQRSTLGDSGILKQP